MTPNVLRRRGRPAVRAAFAVVLACGLAACGRRTTPDPAAAPPDSVASADSVAVSPPPLPDTAFRYVPVPIDGPRALAALQTRLGEQDFGSVLRVNRVDLAHVREGDTLWVPEPMRPRAALSPFPATLAVAARIPDLLLVSARVQAFAVYDSGRLVHWGPTSTGRKESPTPEALYHTNWKARRRISTVSDEWLLEWCVNIHNTQGISLHLYDLPGRPASHSCVRLLIEDAQWVYGWMKPWTLSADGRTVLEPGHPVLVFGAYAFGERRPWRRLAEDPRAASVDEAEIADAIARLGPAPADSTGSAPDSARAAPAL